jgi:hypothetical protein
MKEPEVSQKKAGGCGPWGARCALWGIAVLLALIVMPFVFPRGVVRMLGLLPFGWLGFLKRVTPQISANWDLIGMALVCLLGFLGGSHWFLRWFYGAGRRAASAETVGEGTAGSVANFPEWKLAWTAAINGLLWLCFFIGMSFIGVVHQVGWVSASEEPKLVIRRGGSMVKFVANDLRIHFAVAEISDRASLEVAIRSARDTKGGDLAKYSIKSEEIRLFVLVDTDEVYRGIIIFRSGYENPSDRRIWVYDSRLDSGAQRFERAELSTVMRRYRDELHLVF